MQEAYRPPCSEYSFCCPNWVPPSPSWPGLGGCPAGGVGPYLGTPHPGQGYPAGGYPTWVPPDMVPSILTWPGGTLREYPLAGYHPAGYPPAGYPSAGYPPSWQDTPPSWPGRVPPLAGPGWVTPPRCLPHGILGSVAKHYGIWVPPPVSAPWHSGSCCKALWDMGTPPQVWTDKQSETITFPSYYVRGR